jgi:hypothetical protein
LGAVSENALGTCRAERRFKAIKSTKGTITTLHFIDATKMMRPENIKDAQSLFFFKLSNPPKTKNRTVFFARGRALPRLLGFVDARWYTSHFFSRNT